MAKNKFNTSWLHDHINDPYVKMAQREGYRARAAYKLKEIDEQDKLIRPGQVIVDLGSAPGSWSQYVRNKLAQGAKRDATREGGIDGTIIALDLLPMEPIADVTFIQGDFREDTVLHQLEELVGERQVDLVISDMAPNLSGVALADAARIEHRMRSRAGILAESSETGWCPFSQMLSRQRLQPDCRKVQAAV